jgi:hypothetical protein
MGLSLATEAGFKPSGATSVWNMLEQLRHVDENEYLSTHPTYKHREDRLISLIPSMERLQEQARELFRPRHQLAGL